MAFLRKTWRALKFLTWRFLLVVGGLLLALVLAELGVRAYEAWGGGSDDPEMMRHGLPWGWSYAPGTSRVVASQDGDEYVVTINSLGLRDREYPLEKPDGTFRILVLGDSYGDDGSVPPGNLYHERLEQVLNDSLDVPIEVMNASVSAWDTENQLVFYEEEGGRFNADLVLLAFCLCNDLPGVYEGWEIYDSPTFALREGELIQVNFPADSMATEQVAVAGDFDTAAIDARPRRSLKFQIKKLAYDNLHLFIYIRRAGNAVPLLNRLLIRFGLREEIRVLHQQFMVDETPEMREAWIVSQGLIDRLDNQVQQDGAEFAVLVIPSPYQVEVAHWWEPEFDFFPAMSTVAWDLHRPDTILQGFLQEEHIAYYFLGDGFTEYITQTGELTTWEDNRHWNLTGHELAGRLTAEWLLASGLLPDKG